MAMPFHAYINIWSEAVQWISALKLHYRYPAEAKQTEEEAFCLDAGSDKLYVIGRKASEIIP